MGQTNTGLVPCETKRQSSLLIYIRNLNKVTNSFILSHAMMFLAKSSTFVAFFFFFTVYNINHVLKTVSNCDHILGENFLRNVIENTI